jgi:uncharacterized protein (DUF885 family)
LDRVAQAAPLAKPAIACATLVLLGGLLTACERQAAVVPTPASAATAGAMPDPTALMNALADDWLAHQRATRAFVRLQSGLPITAIDPVTFERAQDEAKFNKALLARLDGIELERLPHEQWLLAKTLRQQIVSDADADEAYWLEFEVTPYSGGDTIHPGQAVLAAQPLKTTTDLDSYLRLLDSYAVMLDQIAAKTRAQAERGIRVPKPAIPGVVAMFRALRAAAPNMFSPAPARLRGTPADQLSAFHAAVQKNISGRVQPAYDAVVAVFDTDYVHHAPRNVGIGQYPGGKERYLRLITTNTGLTTLTPQQIHDMGERRINILDERMAALRKQLGYEGSRAAFHRKLRTDSRFFVHTPAELENLYRSYLARLEPHLPEYFANLPKTHYVLQRLDPGAEQGQTWGYYAEPTAADPIGRYYYNAGSDLEKRSQVWVAHLIYHEIVPGHHLQQSLQFENETAHPARKFLENGAFLEGWGEYAASLGEEMGVFSDPYDLYGNLIQESFIASRLVVDTGMNYLGMSLAQARAYMRAHSIESDAEIDSDTLRYSTDYFAQALCYELGFEKFWELRNRAQQALGARFNLREFHAAAINEGSMPLDVLDEQINWFIAQHRP